MPNYLVPAATKPLSTFGQATAGPCLAGVIAAGSQLVEAITLGTGLSIVSGAIGLAGNVAIPSSLGVSAWTSLQNSLEIGRRGSGLSARNDGNYTTVLTNNAYVNSTPAWIYAATAKAAYVDVADGTVTLASAPSGTAGNAITWTSVLSVEKDKSVALQGAALQTGTGITFPAAQSAASDANTLDDYEEGTWTPGENTVNLVINTIHQAVYQKIGRWCFAYCYLNVTVSNSPVLVFQITGLPFTAAANYGLADLYFTDSGTSPGNRFYTYVSASSNLAQFSYSTGLIVGTYNIMFYFSYQTSS